MSARQRVRWRAVAPGLYGFLLVGPARRPARQGEEMLSALCKGKERVRPLSCHAVTRNGVDGGNAWYPATFSTTSSWLIARICPRSLVVLIFKSVNFIFTAFPFLFRSHC